jgi:hypothetical protein
MAITSFDPVTGAPRHSGQAPAATGGAGVAQAPRYTPDSYSITDVHQTWSMITLRPEYAQAAPERKLEILNNFAGGLQADYGNNPHGLATLVQNAELRIKGEAEQEEQTFSGDLDTHKLHSIIGRMGMPGATSEKEVKGIVDQQYLEYVQGGGRDHVQHPGILSALTDTIGGHVMPGAAGGGLVGAGAGSVVPGLGTVAGGLAGMGYGAIAAGSAGSAVRSRGEALKMRYFSNLDAGMDQKEAWSKAKTAANITAGVVGVVSAIDPTKSIGGKLASGAAGQFTKQQMARAAGTTGATRFGLQVAGRGAVTAGMGAGGEAIDYAQSRAVGNVDDSALMGSLGQRMAISGALGAGIHGTMPVLGKAFKGARVFTGKEYRGKSVGAKWQGMFADETTAGVIGDVANRQSEAEAGARGQGAPDLDAMKGDRFGYMADIEAATKALDDIWSVMTDGSEPVKFKTVEDADGNLKMAAEGIDAQYSRQANEIEAFVGMFRWDKETGQRVTLLHEGVHAFQNTLPKDVLNGLYKLWEAERVNKAGPLYRDGKPAVEGSRPRLAEEGDISQPKAVREMGDEPTTTPAEGGPQLRTNVHPDVNSPRFETSFREWFAEHMAISNDKWAKGKLETAGKRKKLAGARKEGKATSKQVFDVIADVFRGKMEKVGRILGLSSKGMNTVFRDFLDAGDSYVFGRKDRGHTQQLLTDELTGGPEGTAFLAKAMQRSSSKYPTPQDLKNAAEHVAIAGVEGRKRPKMDIVELDAAEPAPRMSDAELSVAQDKVEALKQRSQDKSLSRKERNAAKREVKAIEAKIGEQFLRRETVARRSKFDEERKGEGRDQLEFADDPAGYKDRYEVGGEERAKIAREAREAPDLRKQTLKREARKEAKDDKTIERKGYTEGKGGQLEFDTRSKPKTVQEAVTQKIEDGKDITSKDLEAMRAEIEAEVSGKLKEKRAAEPRLKGETEDGELGPIGRDDVEHSKRGKGTQSSETLNDQINAAKLPKGPLEAAKSLLEAEGKLDGKTEAGFFGKDWPAVLRKTTLQEGSKKDPGVARAVDRSISDVQEFLRNNPRYVDFYNKDWKLARQHLDDAFDETFGHKLSEDEFLFYRMASGLNSSNTQLKPNIGDALNFLHHWVEEGSLDAFKMGPSAKGNLVVKESPFQVSGTTNGIKVRSMLAVETLVKEFDGDVGKAVDHLQEAIPVRDLHAFNRKMGYKGAVGNIGNIKRVVKQATGQDTLIPRMFIFGQKVGAYTLNAIGDSRYNTIDVWEARFARSYFKGMFKNFGLPENVSEHKVFSRFTELFHKRFEEITGREWENSALQAIRWFYMIDSAKRAGYKHATTNDTISGYTKEKLDQRRGRDEASGGRGDETTRRGDGERGDVEHSRRGSQVYSAELIPGKNTGLVPYLFDAPYAARKAFNDEMRSAFADPVTGRDIIAEEMGLRSRGVAQTDDARPSLYFNSFGDPEINPANRVDFQASKPVVETYAALHGLYSKQEAVAGFRPLYQGAVSDEVSFKIKGEPLSEDGVISLGKILSEELGDSAGDVGLFNRRDGFDLVNFSFGGVSRQQMDGLIPRLRDANVLVDEVKAFGIGEDGFYNENNWRSQPKGEGYHDTIRTQGQDSGGGTGRPDLLGRVDRRIAKPVDQVLERWADRVPSDVEHSRRGERVKPEDGAARQFPERAAQSRGASKDLKPIRERRPDIATHTPQSVKERVDTMAGRSDEALMDSVRELETLTRKGDENFHVVDALELLQRARKAGDDATIETVFEHVSKAGTTIGQLLNQFRQFKGVAARDKVALLNNLLIHKGRRLTDKQQDSFRTLVEADDAAVVRLDEAKEKAFADPTDANIKAAQRAEDAQEVTFQKGQRHAQSMMPRESFFADWLAVVQGSLLTGVSQMRNLWGNYLQPVVKLPARTVATAVDATYSKLTGKERTVTMTPVAEAASFLRNSWRATKKIPRNFWTGTPGDKIVGETIRGFQPIRSLEQAFTGDLPVDARTGKVRRRDRIYKVMEAVFGAAPEPMLRGLGAFDDLAKAGFGGMRQAEEAKLRGIKKGTREHAELELGENREVNTAVKETRLEYTFQEDGVVSSAVLGVEQKLNQVPYFGPMFKFGLRVLTSPYVKTPVNLAMQTLSYAFPTVALGEGFYHGVQGNRRGASIAAGKFAVATTLGAMAEYMLEDDIITGGPDHSKKLNKMRGDSGMGYFRINMTGLRRKLSGGDGRYQAGDESIRLDFLGLMGGAFAVRAEAKRLEQRERGYLVKSGLTQDLYLDQLTSVTSLGRFAMDQTMLHGMAQGLRALETGNFNRWQASIVNQLAVTNPVWANTFVQYEASKWTYKPSLYDADPGTSLANIIKYRNGEFDDLTVVRDIWGRPVEQTPEGQDPFIYHMLDLRKPQKVTDQARVRLFQIFEATQDGDVIPSWPSPTITLPNREKLTLPAKLYDGYVETVQGAKLQAFQQIVGDQRWYTMPEAEAVKMLKNRMTRYGSQAKNYWVVQNTPALIEEYRKLVAQQKREE